MRSRLAGHDTLFATVANIGNRSEVIDLRPMVRKLPSIMKYVAVDAKSEHDIGWVFYSFVFATFNCIV